MTPVILETYIRVPSYGMTLAVLILAAGVVVLLVALPIHGAAQRRKGREEAEPTLRAERDTARMERDESRRDGKRKDGEIARLRGELSIMRGLGAQVMSTAARLVNAYDAPTEAETHVIKMGVRG